MQISPWVTILSLVLNSALLPLVVVAIFQFGQMSSRLKTVESILQAAIECGSIKVETAADAALPTAAEQQPIRPYQRFAARVAQSRKAGRS